MFLVADKNRMITIPEPPEPLTGLDPPPPSPHDPPPPPEFANAFIKLFAILLLIPLPPPPFPPKGIFARAVASPTSLPPPPPPAKYTLFSAET